LKKTILSLREPIQTLSGNILEIDDQGGDSEKIKIGKKEFPETHFRKLLKGLPSLRRNSPGPLDTGKISNQLSLKKGIGRIGHPEIFREKGTGDGSRAVYRAPLPIEEDTGFVQF